MLVKLISLVALAATSVAAVATPTVRAPAVSLNPPPSTVNGRELFEPQLEARALTNAERLARGLSLNPPRRRSSPAARSVPSGTVCNLHGYLEVREGSNVLGFLAKVWNNFGEYGAITGDASNRLKVTIDTCGDRINILAELCLPLCWWHHWFSSSSSDLSSGSFNYGYIGGTTQTPALSPPVSGPNSFTAATKIPKTFESAIYRYNAATKEITPQWINTDSAQPATYFGISQDVLVFVGDKTAFTNALGPTKWISVFFVPA
ncbi:hypothetical protein BD779DRAFT_1667936 [Infundibulicybe gibba]|nr:hypothetical protein BD779DRAFT_1667936 [Infundibulicybe gibba]